MKINDIKKLADKHPLYMAFVQQALISYCEDVLKDEAATREYLKTGFISADTWIDVAKEYRQVCK